MTERSVVSHFMSRALCTSLLIGFFSWAAPAFAQGKPADPSGQWCGSWRDSCSGHHGPLQACLRPCGDGRYEATFTGRFLAVIPFRYRVVLDTAGREGERVLFAGTSNLPLFGAFHYRGWADARQFELDFNSRRYQGRFEMAR